MRKFNLKNKYAIRVYENQLKLACQIVDRMELRIVGLRLLNTETSEYVIAVKATEDEWNQFKYELAN